jgi:hypothetical protein
MLVRGLENPPPKSWIVGRGKSPRKSRGKFSTIVGRENHQENHRENHRANHRKKGLGEKMGKWPRENSAPTPLYLHF